MSLSAAVKSPRFCLFTLASVFLVVMLVYIGQEHVGVHIGKLHTEGSEIEKSAKLCSVLGLQTIELPSLNELTHVESEKPCPVAGLQSNEQYRAYLHHTESSCSKMVQFGGRPPAPGDGAKFVCLDKRFNIKPGNCTVFSFGVNNEWSFEDDFAKFGCKVYAFDPTMGKEDHQRSANVQFLAVGIANYKGTKKIGMDKIWTMQRVDRFENLVNQLGLAGQEIDFVKLDVELSEVDFLQDMLLNSPHVLKNIKQIAMEVHDDYYKGDLSQTSRQQVFWPYFMLLKCQDFQLIQSRDAGRWREVVWSREVKW